MGQRNFIDDVLRAAAVSKRKNRDFRGRILLIVSRNLGSRHARIQLDQVIEPGLAAVCLESVLVAEECAVLVVRLRAASCQRAQNRQAYQRQCDMSENGSAATNVAGQGTS